MLIYDTAHISNQWNGSFWWSEILFPKHLSSYTLSNVHTFDEKYPEVLKVRIGQKICFHISNQTVSLMTTPSRGRTLTNSALGVTSESLNVFHAVGMFLGSQLPLESQH